MMQEIDKTTPIRGLNELDNENGKELPPVHLWHPKICHDIDMRIDRDGQWHYMGSPIERERMVKLFASIMRRDDDDRYYLVTPAEKCGIEVEDVPFVATGMDVSGAGQGQMVRFVTNVGDVATAGKLTPLRFTGTGEPDVFVPYVLVRGRLEARVNRAVFYDLVEIGSIQPIDGTDWFGVWSGGQFWRIAPAADIGAV